MAQATLFKDNDDASAVLASDFPVLHRRDESDPMQLLPQEEAAVILPPA